MAGKRSKVNMEIIRSVCNICPSLCGIKIHLEDGEIKKITGDKESESGGFLCRKGKALIEYANHRERILYPIKRVGERGSGNWKRISWDEAFETIVYELERVKSKYGPQAVAFLRGAVSGLPDMLFTRLAYAFGSPNVTSMGFLCFMPRVYAYNATFGSFLYPDYDFPPKTIVLWGLNPYATYPFVYRKITSAKRNGSKIIVVDPFETEMVKIADLWIRPRPGSDILLCLSILNIVVEEGLYDREFVQKWTYGFERLKSHVRKFHPRDIEKYTWVKENDVRAFAEMYTKNRPASIAEGNALDQGVFPFQTLRAIYILEAVCGNIGVPGGKIRYKNPKAVEKYGPSFTLRNLLPKETISTAMGKELLAPFVHYALPQTIVKSLIDGNEKSPKAAFILRGNLVLTWPDTRKTLEALKKLDFLFVADHFLTPTSSLADVILPSATCLEFDSIAISSDFPFIIHAQRKAKEFGEAQSDIWIINELGKRLGMKDYFFGDEYEIYDEILREDNLTFSEFKERGLIVGEKEYRFFEKEGFKTSSKKVEIFSESLHSNGYNPLPDVEESYFRDGEDYPFVLTSYKPRDFRHTNFRQIESIRKRNPYPRVFLNRDLASAFEIKEGQWLTIETRTGRIKAKTHFKENIDRRVVILEHGWWLPEAEESYLDMNLNMLTSSDFPLFPITGSPQLRGVPCRIVDLLEKNG